ncbi:MAG: orotidine-5'-phosphate decarboxylase [Planctomycetes bacterium]|nr:orotidine-5'-phosphate decarboxylase [Planctomycetota bacterium]
MSATTFPQRLRDAARSAHTCLVVGLDPHWEELPEGVRKGAPSPAQACETFARGLLDACAGACAGVKVQVACFERFGSAGFAALERVLADARARGILTIADAKRGDIATSARHYAQAFLAKGAPFESDALTIQSVFGADGVEPFAEALRAGKGLFALVRTSNPTAGEIQDLPVDGEPWHLHLARRVRAWGEPWRDGTGYSALGAVVGATALREAMTLREATSGVWLLCPGIGAQGGDAAAVRSLADARGLGVLPVAARSIAFAFRETKKPDAWIEAARDACRRHREMFPL